MAEIVPAINVGDFNEVARRIRVAEKYASRVHIDIADGTFTPTITWHASEDLKGFQTPARIEIHLMVKNPEEKIASWLIPEVSRIIIHTETTKQPEKIIDQCHASRIEAGVSICPETSWEVLGHVASHADMLHVLAVSPGPSGQKFDMSTLDKIKNLKNAFPKLDIEVDGGIRVGIAKSCMESGAEFLVAGSSLFGEGVSFEAAYTLLKNDIQHAG